MLNQLPRTEQKENERAEIAELFLFKNFVSSQQKIIKKARNEELVIPTKHK